MDVQLEMTEEADGLEEGCETLLGEVRRKRHNCSALPWLTSSDLTVVGENGGGRDAGKLVGCGLRLAALEEVGRRPPTALDVPSFSH